MKLILLKNIGLNRAGDIIEPDSVVAEILIKRGIAKKHIEKEKRKGKKNDSQ
jgi:hypothetical protein